ncbi:MAG: hypothetical protein LBM65_01985, partial [Oscillospiraceae bacterium]|nr:hypothetical protein [Oscillospiraceae bacterium]
MSVIITFVVETKYSVVKAETYLKKAKNISSRLLATLKQTANGITCNGELLKTTDMLYAADAVTLALP